jgi:hypothetical protein
VLLLNWSKGADNCKYDTAPGVVCLVLHSTGSHKQNSISQIPNVLNWILACPVFEFWPVLYWILACPVLDTGLSCIGYWSVLYWILACPVLDTGLSCIWILAYIGYCPVLYWILACLQVSCLGYWPVLYWIPVCPQECPSLVR